MSSSSDQEETSRRQRMRITRHIMDNEKNIAGALIHAIQQQDTYKVRELVRSGLSINKYIKYGHDGWLRCFTPLAIALNHSAPKEILECLIAAGADVNKSSRQYKQGTLERYTPLFNACEKDDLDLVRWLIVAGADVNHSVQGTQVEEEEGGSFDYTDEKNTPLHWAAYHNRPELVHLLIDNGANGFLTNESSETALHIACEEFHRSVIELLVRSGAVPNNKDAFENSPLNHLLLWRQLCNENCEDVIKLIVTCGYNITTDRNLWIPRPGESLAGTNIGGAQNMDMLKWLSEWKYSPRTLKEVCRYKIRDTLGHVRLKWKVGQLPLPTFLIRYVNMENM